MRQANTCILISLLISLLAVCGCKMDSEKAQFQDKGIAELKEESLDKAKTEIESHTAVGTESSSTIAQFLKLVEKEFCASTLDDLNYCYESHSTGIKSDFLQKLPITINKPYDKPIDWDRFKQVENFSELWSIKCGFQNEKTGVELRYHCPNLNGELGAWLKKVSKSNDFINSFYSEYNKYQDFSTSMQQNMFLQADEELDFNMEDHRAFYWMFHLSLAELRHANARFKKMNI